MLVFDLDGTLSDPLVGIHRCMNHALVSSGFKEVSEARVATLIGPPLEDAFRALVPAEGERVIVQLISRYRERYSDVGFSENTLYEGVADILAALYEHGVTIGVCTSKRADFAERILERFGILSFMSFVDGGDVGVTKTRQLASLSRSGITGPGWMMVGDRAVDMTAARENGLLSVGVLWGYGSEAELVDAGAQIIITKVQELAQLPRLRRNRAQ